MAHYGYAPGVTEAMRRHVQADFHFVPRPDAQGYGDGQIWELGGVTVRAIHMPGHTGGHSVLFVEPDGVAFIGDIDLSGFGPYYGDACSDLAQFVDSLERMGGLDAKVWITSHHKGAVTNREDMLGLLARYRHRVTEREQAIMRALDGEGMSLPELVARRFLYPPGYHEIFVDDVERKTIREHLKLLMREGRVVEEGGRYRLTGRG
jgi:glyoxylase-like metal-dependent hydrolase (beta-lactamase superfamily II)